MDDVKIQVNVEFSNGKRYSKSIRISNEIPNTEFVYVLTKAFEQVAKGTDKLKEENE